MHPFANRDPFISATPRNAGSALIDARANAVVTHADLGELVASLQVSLGGCIPLVLFECASVLECMRSLVTLSLAQVPLILVDSGQPESYKDFVAKKFEPDFVLNSRNRWDLSVLDAASATKPSTDPSLACLVATSGSTGGAPKFAAFTHAARRQSADCIATSLAITPSCRGVTSLPVAYAYGLSVVMSHLHAGGSVLVTGTSIADGDFWRQCREARVSQFASTPTGYQMALKRFLMDPAVSQFRQWTVAGGRLDEARLKAAISYCHTKSIDFRVMYGQTEAGPRISCTERMSPSTEVDGYVGIPVTGMTVTIRDSDGGPVPAGSTGSVWCSSITVMSGYVTDRGDLIELPRQPELLQTGDEGRIDGRGHLWVVGRRSRFAKPFDRRVSLDELESGLSHVADLIAVDLEGIIGFVPREEVHEDLVSTLRREASLATGLPATTFQVFTELPIPVLGSGKVDLAALTDSAKKALSALRQARSAESP